MARNLKVIFPIVCIGLILTVYQNCGSPMHSGFVEQASSGVIVVDPKSQAIFARTVYPTLLENCASCHATEDPKVAASNVQIAFSAVQANFLVNFNNAGDSKLVRTITSGHEGVVSGLSAEIQAGVQDWIDELASPNPNPDDLLKPTVAITSPAANASVAGTLNIAATASDNIGVARVQFLIDGANLGVADTTAPYSLSVNTTTLSNGMHILTAQAFDAAGNSTISSVVVINVNNMVANPNATFTYLSANVFSRCLVCHGPQTQSGGFRYDSWSEVRKALVPGDPEASKIYFQIGPDGSMPRGGGARVSDQDVEAMRAWIAAGALNN